MCAPIRRYLLPEHRLSSPRLHIAFVVSDERSEPTGWRPEDELPLAELGVMALHARALVHTRRLARR
jgi:hypothetical protein